jgi:hypothetical protein
MPRASENYNLLSINPNLSQQWHPTKNRNLTPKDVAPSSKKKVWWICKKGHEWEARVYSRNYGSSCPFCAGRALCKDNCLQTINPELSAEWHPTKNGNLTPEDIVANSTKKVWWICKKSHEWQAIITDRNKGGGCPFCAGRAVCKDNCLQTINPELSAEWHPTKNGSLTPYDVTSNSNKKVWWKCSKGHEWEANIAQRNRSSGCPFCAGRAVCKDNCLQAINPKLSDEWHPIKNGSLTPYDVTSNSNKKVWWKCSKGHEWEANIAQRNRSSGCPFCANQKVCHDNCLYTVNPELSEQWHPIKNGKLTSKDVLPKSSKKVWWLCKKGHEWQATIYHRSHGTGCPYCAGKAVSPDNCLKTINPKLSNEWHSTKNDDLTPEDVVASSGKKVWWICEKGHEWEAIIAHRNRGGGCPYCAGRAVCKDNCLQTINPKLSKEWHPTKNGSLTPRDVTFGSGKKIWWKCKRGHEWEAPINIRNRGVGCPFCHSQTSQLEIRIWTELKYLFKEVTHRKKLYGVECDLYMPESKLAIEIDGFYYHKDRFQKDQQKSKKLTSKGIRLLRVREKGLERISDTDIFFSKNKVGFSLLRKILANKVFREIDLPADKKSIIKNYIKNGKFVNNDEYKQLLYMLPSPLPGYSLKDKNPDLAKEWHPTKNGILRPEDVTPGSEKMVWWICKKGHEWKALVSSRKQGSGCPYCAGHKVCEDNCLATLYPEIAKEWHPVKNGKITPKDVTKSPKGNFWWICDKGHEWEARIYNRVKGHGCPKCGHEQVANKLRLTIMDMQITAKKRSGKCISTEYVDTETKLLWECSKGHQWWAKPGNIRSGKWCPECAGNIRSSIERYQAIAKERGGFCLSKEYVNAHTKLLWQCKFGHQWEATPNTIQQGSWCLECYRNRKHLKP